MMVLPPPPAAVEFHSEVQWVEALARGCSHPSRSQSPRPHAHCGTTCTARKRHCKHDRSIRSDINSPSS